MSEMSNFIKYLGVQMKRSFKMYPLVLCFTLVLSLCIMMLLSSLVASENSSEKNIRIKIGLVGDIEDTHLGIGITALQEFDTSRYYVEFVPTDEAQAQKMLKNGTLMGYVSVPDDFVDSIIHGTNKHLTYVSGNTPTALNQFLVKEVISIVSDLVIESQNGIYAMAELAEKYDIEYSELHDAMEELNILYFDSIFSREEMYDVQTLGTGNGLGFADYYFCSFLILLMMLWGIICVPLMVKSDMSLSRLLYSRSGRVYGQVIGEYIPFSLLILINTVILITAAGFFTGKIEGAGFFEIFLDSERMLSTVIYLIPCIAVITAMQFFLYEISTNIIAAVMVQLLATLSLSYISGFLYPSGSLPAVIQKISAYTPTGVTFNYLSDMFTDIPGFGRIIPLVGYFVVFIIASMLVRRVRIRSVR